MKHTLYRLIKPAAAVASLATLFVLAQTSGRADDIWKGTGPDGYWTDPANWRGNVAPSAGDSLVFTNVNGLNNTNNFAAATAFANLTFATPSGAFALSGNSITLNGNITNKQPVTVESLNLPLILGISPSVDVTANGVLTINGVVSGANGLTKTDGGLLNLNAVNTFTGPLTVDGGTVAVAGDANLGTAPGSLTAGSLVLDSGALKTTASFALSANRGIAVGPGFGGINVASGTALTYGGVIADNGGAGGLTKDGYGTLTLSGANTYTGSTTNLTGVLALDFTRAGSPQNNVINSSSSLSLGGGNAGAGAENVAQLVMIGASSIANTQDFSSAHFTFGGSAVVATNGAGGTATLGLGALSHDPGGTLALVSAAGTGGGSITTTSPNVNGILGGWALISGDGGFGSIYTDSGHSLFTGTNFASVDANSNIVNFIGYTNYSFAGTFNSQILGSLDPNFLVNASASGGEVATVDNNNAGTTNDVNAIKWLTGSSGFDSVFIGQGNTLRLGRYGGIIRQGPSTGNACYIGGLDSSVQSGSGTSGSGDVGTLTAGGADNTPGEIVVTVNNPSETTGTTIFESRIADNGSGAVTVVKQGPGSIKLDGHNTFSGGLYLLQGRVQFSGSEIGNANPDAGGLGTIYVLPGAYLFPSGTGGGAITNALVIAGNGDAHENLGALRGGTFTGPVTLIGDANIGANAILVGPITGAFNLTLGSAATVNGGATLSNPNNAWTGDTILTARSNTGNNTITSSNNEVIPDGFGKGNVTMQGYSTGTVQWDLHGYSETINGLSTSGNGPTCFIENNVATTASTLTVGGNDQSGTFAGLLRDSTGTGGTLALTKIGAGVETLTASNTYSGPTVINDGTLALSGSGSIANSAGVQINSGGTLDVSALNGAFATASPVGVNGGSIIGDGSVGNLGLTNAALTLNIDTAGTNILAAALSTGGATNLININTISGVSKYPAYFPILKYSGSLGGAGNNFGLGDVPNTNTVGFVSNDVANARIVLVLLNGPKVLTWTGADPVNPTFWDVATTTNWIAFKGTIDQAPSVFSSADAVIFDDTGSTGTVNVAQEVGPGSLEVTNNSLNYAFTGAGGIGGKLSVVKDGPGSLLLDNGGNNGVTIAGGFTIVNGTVQVGNNDANGTLSAASGVVNNGTLVFDRSDSVTNNSAISGTGPVSQVSAGTLTLSGNNSFSGGFNVTQGTLAAGSGTALGSTNSTTTISSGATLDVGGQTLDLYPVVVSGVGVGGNGSIVNSGGQSLNAMGNVTLTGDTTFGGTGRWDIRGGAATLSTGGNPYNLTKQGTNYVALVGVNVDGSLGNINVQSGTLSVETTSTGLGNSGNTLTVATNATFQVYNSTVTLYKQFVLNGNGVATSLNCGNGVANNLNGNFTLTGNCLFNAVAGSAVSISGGTMGGAGALIKVGPGTNIIGNAVTAGYTGGTLVSGGTFVVDGSLSGNVNVSSNATLAGVGTASGAVTVTNATVAPGDLATSPQGTLTLGSLTLSNSTLAFELGTASSNLIGNDKLIVTSGLVLSGTNTLQITPVSYMSVGDIYTNVLYGGAPLPSSVTNVLRLVVTRAGFSFHIVDPATTPGAIAIQVDTALGNDLWTGATSANWDTNTVNWNRNGSPANFNNADYANFDDTASQYNVSLVGGLNASGITLNNSTHTYVFAGSGNLTNTGTMQLNGSGTVTIANSGNNNFQGLITINSGVLQVGNGGNAGNLGLGGSITNNSSLVFNRSDSNLVVNSVIGGLGSLTNIGTGMVTLGGANTFDGEVDVVQGTLRVANSSALGDTFGATVISPGATLDITNTANVGKETITVSGAGAGGNGAIVNNSGSATFVGPNFSQLTIASNTVFGGSGRLDFRASAAAAADAVLFCSPIGQPYTLTKVGTNQFQVSGVSIDPGLGDIDVQGGTFGLQWQLPLGLGNSGYSLILHSNTTLNLFDLSNNVAKVFIFTNATVYNQHATTNVLTGPFTLSGTNTFNVAYPLVLQGPMSGDGGVVVAGGSTLFLQTGPASYTGDTRVSGSTLAVADPVALTNSPNIVLAGGTVDLSGRADDTLALGGGGLPQFLAGGGTIAGTLVENSGSTVHPGNGLAPVVLTVTNGVTLNGAVIMDLNRAAGAVTNDEIMVVSNLSLTASGTLTVTNLGPTLAAGDTFQLFNVPVSGFASVNLPTTNNLGTVAYTWQNNLASAGSITVAGSTYLFTTPTNITFAATNKNLTLSWPVNYTGWTLQAQTNKLTVGLGTNWVDVAGSANTNSVTVPIVTTNGTVFYRLKLNP